MIFLEKVKELTERRTFANNQNLFTDILQNQFRYFHLDQQLKKLILWEVSTQSPLMRSIHNVRKSVGEQLFALTSTHFERTSINFGALRPYWWEISTTPSCTPASTAAPSLASNFPPKRAGKICLTLLN